MRKHLRRARGTLAGFLALLVAWIVSTAPLAAAFDGWEYILSLVCLALWGAAVGRIRFRDGVRLGVERTVKHYAEEAEVVGRSRSQAMIDNAPWN